LIFLAFLDGVLKFSWQTREGTTFLVKRFDRAGKARIHMASAMTMLGKTDNDNYASYLDIADWITAHSSQAQDDLRELWMRIVFNIVIANTDDHLRNHAFLLLKPEFATRKEREALCSVGFHALFFK